MSHTLKSGLKDETLLAVAEMQLAVAESSASCRALAGELALLQEDRRMPTGIVFDARRHRDGRPIFIVRCDNGWHESFNGFEEALELLLEAHRTRVEDLETTHQRMLELWGGDDMKTARRRCAELAARVRAANPDADGPQRDALVLAELERLEADRARRDAEERERERP